MNSLPIIDIAPLYSDDAAAWPAVAEAIDRACRDRGFFYIVGHPIGGARIDALLSAAKTFLPGLPKRNSGSISPRPLITEATARSPRNSSTRTSRAT